MTEFVEAILAQIIGNISTALIVVIFYFNFLLFESYLRLIVWAILFSQALRQAKNNVVSVLQYLSDDPDVNKHGFLTCVFSKSFEIIFRHSHGKTRSPKELFLNYGVFIFSMIGGISIWMRVFSWIAFVRFSLGFCLIGLGLIKLLDRRIFFYRYFISDEVLVSTVLILGFFTTGIFVIVYLGTESYLEGSRAASDLTAWVQKNFVNDEQTRQLWNEQVENSRLMITSAFHGFENNYNDTMWWPPLKSLVKTYYLDGMKMNSSSSPSSYYDGNHMMMMMNTTINTMNSTSSSSSINSSSTESMGMSSSSSLSSSSSSHGISNLFYTKLSLPSNVTLIQALSMAYAKVDGVNFTSVQLTDWTSKGLEVSSIMFGSLTQLFFLIFTIVIAFVSLGIRAFFFISSLFYLLCTKWDPIERFVEDLLPIQIEKRPQVVRSLRRVIEGVFFLPLKMSSLHSIVTLVSLNAVNADFIYLATTLTFIISIVPIIPPYLVCLPWVLSIWITCSFIKAICLFSVHYILFTFFDDALYEKSIGALNSYISALSVVFGVYVFGIEGVIFGPLSVCGVYFAYEVSNHGIQAASYEETSTTKQKISKKIEHTKFSTSINTNTKKCSKKKLPIQKTKEEEEKEEDQEEKEEEEEEEIAPTSSNIFSNAYRVMISGGDNRFGFQPLANRMKRTFSIDLTSKDTICIVFVIDYYDYTHKRTHRLSPHEQQQHQIQTPTPRRVRYAINKSWSQTTLLQSLSRTLHLHGIQGIYTEDGVEILSPSHIFPNEILYIKLLHPNKHSSMNSSSSSSSSTSTISSNSIRTVISNTSSKNTSGGGGGGGGGKDGLHVSPPTRHGHGHGHHHHHHPYLKVKDRRKIPGNVLNFEDVEDSEDEKITPRLRLKRIQSVDPVIKTKSTTTSPTIRRRSSFASVESALRGGEPGSNQVESKLSSAGVLNFTPPFLSPSTPKTSRSLMKAHERNHSISFTSSLGSSDLFAIASSPSTTIMVGGESDHSNLNSSNNDPQPINQSLSASTSSTMSIADETVFSPDKQTIAVDQLAQVVDPSTNNTISVANLEDKTNADFNNKNPQQKGICIHLNPRGEGPSVMQAGFFPSSPININDKNELTTDGNTIHLSTPKPVGSNDRSQSVSNTLHQQSPQRLHPHPKSKSVGDLRSIQQEENNGDEVYSKARVKNRQGKEKRRGFWRRLFGKDKESN